MSKPKHIIIYSHGFGVRKDDLGLLSGIAEALPESESILFDYFDVDEEKKILTICPMSEQVEKLNQVIGETKASNPEAIIDLIGHSQGTIIMALAKPDGIRKTILLSPPFDMSLDRTLARYRSKPEAKIDIEGTSIIPSSTGLTRIIPKEYWQERVLVKPFEEYNVLAKKTEITVIIANQDELIPKVDLTELSPKIKIIAIDGDHNFNDSARAPLIKTIKDICQG